MSTDRILRITAGLIAGAGLVLLALFGVNSAKRHAANKIQSIITKLESSEQFPVHVGRWKVGMGDVAFEQIEAGTNRELLVSQVNAKVSLNPFSDDFGKLDEIEIGAVRTTLSLTDVSDLLKQLWTSPKESSPNKSKSSAKGRTAPIADLLTVKNGGFTLKDQFGRTVYRGRGGTLQVSLKSKSARFSLARLYDENHLLEQGVAGFVSWQPKSAKMLFEVGKPNPDSNKSHWRFKGTIATDFSSGDFTVDATSLPKPVRIRLERWLTDTENTRLNAKVEFKSRNGGYSYSFRGRTRGITMATPILANQKVGPFPLNFKGNGFYHPLDHLFVVDSATLVTRPSKKNRRKIAPIKISVNGGMRGARGVHDEREVFGTVQLPVTACNQLVHGVPDGFADHLREFDLGGTMELVATFNIPMKSPDQFFFEVKKSDFTCQVIKSPRQFSKQYLQGPFTIAREMNKDGTPVKLDINPLSDGFTPLEAVSRGTNLAFVTSEDAGFWKHKGIDTHALDNALRKNLTEGRIALGGSTITMQTVKNLFLTHERTLSRKYQEMFLAWHLEQILDKNRILELYMNIIEFGPKIYGITNAADHYFDKHPFDLNLKESAFLASLLPSPVKRYRHFCNGETNEDFNTLMESLLRRMLNLHRINWSAYIRARNSHLNFNDKARWDSGNCGTPSGNRSSG